MELKPLKPRKALNKAYLKEKPSRTEIEGFKTNLIKLIGKIDEIEREENQKNHLRDFLRDTYYKDIYEINTKDTKDLVIHHGKSNKTDVGVIIEAKRPSNKSEMLKPNDINKRAFHELLLYYLRERISEKNHNIKHLIISNIYEWYVFNEQLFERLFAQNKSLVKQFQVFASSGKTTDVFYKEIAEPFIAGLKNDIEFTHFDIREFEIPLRNKDKKDDNKLIALYKLLSPEHLLKLPFANDSNSLDKRFYGELLHIIGLTETKDGSKKLIERNTEGNRNYGSFIENAIIQLDSLDKISRLENPSHFGANAQERLFNVALELSITWINRILFLKLLEGQLITYHKGDKSYEFFNTDKIQNYDDLNSLFFQVLARKHEERSEDVKPIFTKVPYLNSSLFEPTDIEHTTLFISNLRDDKTIPIYSQTVLKDEKGKRLSGELSTLQYLFKFLAAYDFSSEGSEEIQEDNKTLINASVLGLIFEKINGYKDGSFFTPGFITMYMCRETIRKAVVQKFNEAKGWKCNDFSELSEDVHDAIRGGNRKQIRLEANEIINSIRICDPAVGSGHFLVSALNEIIAIKSELKVLVDNELEPVSNIAIEIANDDLVITNLEDELFEYSPQNKESQRIQETLFHEKQTIIENCLFGVDINPNSVKICRLRLWIELLKNAYYKNAIELETLPNIDINIKCGNSLVSRFGIDADLKQALKKKDWTIDSYRKAVDTYRNAESRDQKREMERLISNIKNDFETNIDTPFKGKLSRARGKVDKIATGINTQKQWGEEVSKKLFNDLEKATKLFKKLEAERHSIENNKIFENAFEWRFEFPEVLNDDGDFVGFDVVIGNPPYVNAMELKKSLTESEYNFYKSNYITAKGSVDLYIYFFELGYIILRDNSYLNYITPNRFLSASYGLALREFMLNKSSLLNIGDFSNVKVFKEASTYPITTLFQKVPNNHNLTSFTFIEEYQPIKYRTYRTEDLFSLNEFILGFVLSEKYGIVSKVISQSVALGECGTINATSTAKEADEFNSLINENEGFKLINTGTIDKYSTTWGKTSLVDKKKKFLTPYLPKSESALGKNRFDLYSTPKIIFAKIAITPEAFYDENGEYASVNTNCIHAFSSDYRPEFILGWVNSKLFQYLFECFFDGLKMSGGYLLYSAPNLLNTYIKPASKQEQDKIAMAVRKIMSAIKEDGKEDINELENLINQLIYQLYGLSEEEINIIENN